MSVRFSLSEIADYLLAVYLVEEKRESPNDVFVKEVGMPTQVRSASRPVT